MVYNPTTGRFSSLDPYEGDPLDPQSFHKYAYVHGDPIQHVDPTGKFLASVGIAALGRAGLRAGHLTLGLGLVADAALLTLWIRRHNARDYTEQLPISNIEVWSNSTFVQINNAELTAGEMFERLASFNPDDYEPFTLISPRRHNNDYITFSFDHVFSIGQNSFDVRIDQYSRQERFMSVVTLSGHPLSGFRYFRVVAASDQATSYTIETAAVDHPTLWNDYVKMRADYFTLDELKKTWRDSFTAMARASGGTFSAPQSLWFDETSNSEKIENIKSLVNWRTR